MSIAPAVIAPRGLGDGQYRAVRWVAGAGALFLTVYAAGLIIRPGEAYLRVQSNLTYNLPALAALALSVVAIRRSRGRERWGWLSMAALLVSWQAGDWLFSYYDLVLGREPPFPGYADIAYYVGYLAFVAAIALLTFAEQRLRDRRWLFDAAIVVVVGGTIAWEYLMRPVVAESGDAFSAAVALGYPLLDLALLTALLAALYTTSSSFSRPALVLSAAAVLQIVTDSGYSYVVTTTGYDNVGNPLELGWLGAYVLLAVCFVIPDAPASAGRQTRPSLLGLVLPYAAGVPLVGLVVASAVRGEPSTVLIVATVAAVALVVLRQFLTLRDNLALLIEAANYDGLTHLPNRRRFEEEAGRRLARRGEDARHALLMFGLDDFKSVNDGLGHHVGDEVIVRVAQQLAARFEDGEGVARLGGDEFAVLLSGVASRDGRRIARETLGALREQPVIVEGQIMRITASAGVAIAPDHGVTMDELLGHASLAMHQAKAAGGNDARLYEARDHGEELSESRLLWKRRIREALEEDRFVLFCQPIVDLQTRRVCEYELLLRMRDEQGGLLPPAAFLGVAQRSGLIQDIDRWVLRSAVHLALDYRRRGFRLPLAVNLSSTAFEGNDLVQMVEGLLATTGVDGADLILEITESAAVTDFDRAQRFIEGLKRLGCQFALDDFGVGFSSFDHLKRLPVDYLKIDGSFIRDLPANEVDQHLVRAIVGLARALDKRTVAEFVQDDETVRLLREIGVDYGQGYHLGMPAPVSEVLVAQRPAREAA